MQVMVRLSSIGFCLAELADVHTKLFKMAFPRQKKSVKVRQTLKTVGAKR